MELHATSPSELLERAQALLASNANEAETRLKLIDRILFQVLGWTHDDVNVETRILEDDTSQFTDYICSTAIANIVVEAKRIDVTFDDLPKTRKLTISRLLRSSAAESIRQVRDYARKASVGFAAVTNGTQWIVFAVNRTDQVPFEQSAAIVFDGLTSILRDDLEEFTGLLSRSAVINNSLIVELIGRTEDQIANRRLNGIFARSFSKVERKSLYPIISEAIAIAFTEDFVVNDPDLLEKCYVKTADRQRYDHKIRMYLGQRDIPIEKAVAKPLRPKDEKALVDIIEDTKRRTRPLAVLAIGSVGAGKTTFLNYTRLVAAKDIFEDVSEKRPLWFHIDFRNWAEHEAPAEFVEREILGIFRSNDFISSFERCIRPAYRSEIDALLNGPLFLLSQDDQEKKRRISEIILSDYQKVGPYVTTVLSYVSKNVPVFLVIDNVDQFEDSNNQARIFKDVMALSRRVGAKLIISLRESTYIKNKTLPAFDAFDFDPLYIEAPLVNSVLSRRFFVAKQLLHKKPTSYESENGIRFDIADSSIIVDLVQGSVLGTEVGTLIDVLATSDIRLALRMTREFLQFGYTATGKALQIYQATGKYVLPRHEALRAIMLGNQSVYAEKYSVVWNPFDARLGITKAQLLRLYVLNALTNMSGSASFERVPGETIRQAVREIGFGDNLAIKVLQDLCAARFIHTASHGDATFEAAYLPTRLGGYIIKMLMGNMMFLENVMMDTFIADTGVWEQLNQVMNEVYAERNVIRRIKRRRYAVSIFFHFMKSSYSDFQSESLRRGLAREWCTNPFEYAETLLYENFRRAIASAERNYGIGEQRK